MLAVGLSVLLGAAFVVAGVAKIALGAGWRAQAHVFGAPSIVAPVLPWFEIGLGALAIAQVARRWVALVLAAMLVAFTAAMVAQLRSGRRPPCACFGSWSTKPLGPAHIARNAVLLAVAVAVVALD